METEAAEGPLPPPTSPGVPSPDLAAAELAALTFAEDQLARRCLRSGGPPQLGGHLVSGSART
jgi:hypothetical protein